MMDATQQNYEQIRRILNVDPSQQQQQLINAMASTSSRIK